MEKSPPKNGELGEKFEEFEDMIAIPQKKLPVDEHTDMKKLIGEVSPHHANNHLDLIFDGYNPYKDDNL